MLIQLLTFVNQHAQVLTTPAMLSKNVYSFVLINLQKLMLKLKNVLKDAHKTIMVKTVQEHVGLIVQICKIFLLMIPQIFVLQHVHKDYLLRTQLINVYHNALSVLMLTQQQEFVF